MVTIFPTVMTKCHMKCDCNGVESCSDVNIFIVRQDASQTQLHRKVIDVKRRKSSPFTVLPNSDPSEASMHACGTRKHGFLWP